MTTIMKTMISAMTLVLAATWSHGQLDEIEMLLFRLDHVHKRQEHNLPWWWDASLILSRTDAIVVADIVPGIRTRRLLILGVIDGELQPGDSILFFHPSSNMRDYVFLGADEALFFLRKMTKEEIADTNARVIPVSGRRLPGDEDIWTFATQQVQWQSYTGLDKKKIGGRIPIQLERVAGVQRERDAILNYVRELSMLWKRAFDGEKIPLDDLDDIQRDVVSRAARRERWHRDFVYAIDQDTVIINRYWGSGETIKIPPTIEGKPVTAINERAFEGRRNLTSVNIPGSVTNIGDNAFVGCTSLESVNIPDSVTNIGDRAFSGCISLERITIPDSVISIGRLAFAYNSSLTNVNIGSGVTSIPVLAFVACTNLPGITIPDNVTAIRSSAFENCRALTSITIPDSVTFIGGRVFWGCSSLTNVNIGNSVSTVGLAVFDGCENLEEINFPSGPPPASREILLRFKAKAATIGVHPLATPPAFRQGREGRGVRAPGKDQQ